MSQTEDTVTLREYLEASIAGVERESILRHETLKEAVNKAEADLNLRLEAMDGFRAQLAAQRGEFATNERLDDATSTMRSLYDALVSNINVANETLRDTAERDIEALRDRMDKDAKARDDANNNIVRQLGTYLTNDRANTIMSDGQVRWDAIRTQYEREGKQRDDAINALQQQFAGLVGRLAGMGIIVVLASLAVQVILAIITHGKF